MKKILIAILLIVSLVGLSASALAEDQQNRRTFNKSWQIELFAKAEAGGGGVIVLDAGCGGKTYEDKSFSDVSNENPNHWVCYDANGVEVFLSDYKGKIETAPMSLCDKHAAIAKKKATSTG